MSSSTGGKLSSVQVVRRREINLPPLRFSAFGAALGRLHCSTPAASFMMNFRRITGRCSGQCCAAVLPRGSAWGPVIPPVFKTGARHLRGVVGVFDSHTLPPLFSMT
jgi:hypothetical protein